MQTHRKKRLAALFHFAGNMLIMKKYVYIVMAWLRKYF